MEKNAATQSGSLKISNDVIIKIAELAASEIDGVAAKGQKLEMIEAPVELAKRFLAPVSVKLSKEAAIIDVNIIVEKGHKAVSVAQAVQSSVKSAVQSMAGIAVAKVNVKINGIKVKKE